MVVTSAPGKVILLGEHAVVFGRPAIALAIGLRSRCRAQVIDGHIGSGDRIGVQHGSYVSTAIQQNWDGRPLDIEVQSQLPSGSGLGSSAAVTVAALGAMASLKGQFDAEAIARQAFEVESLVQGRASPIDTSVSAHGKAIFISSERGSDLLWHITKDTRSWYIHNCEVPDMTLVVGFTGNKAPTGPLVAKVKRYVDHTRFAREIIDEIGDITMDGLNRMRSGDVEGLGRLMSRNHALLTILGVCTTPLQKLVDAALPHSYGAKLTGAGGGGSMIALTDTPEKVAEAIKGRGGIPFIVRTGVEGVKVEE